MFQRILIPLDGSPGAERAIPVAARLARTTNGTLVFLHIVAPATSLGSKLTRSQRAAELHNYKKEALRTEAIEKVMSDAASYLAKLPTRYATDLAEYSHRDGYHLWLSVTHPALRGTHGAG